jgi:hypothetical protein
MYRRVSGILLLGECHYLEGYAYGLARSYEEGFNVTFLIDDEFNFLLEIVEDVNWRAIYQLLCYFNVT